MLVHSPSLDVLFMSNDSNYSCNYQSHCRVQGQSENQRLPQFRRQLRRNVAIAVAVYCQ